MRGSEGGPLGSAAAALQAVLVEEVLAQSPLGTQAAQVGDIVAQLLDGFHLLVQVVGLQQVTELWAENGGKMWSLKIRCWGMYGSCAPLECWGDTTLAW